MIAWHATSLNRAPSIAQGILLLLRQRLDSGSAPRGGKQSSEGQKGRPAGDTGGGKSLRQSAHAGFDVVVSPGVVPLAC